MRRVIAHDIPKPIEVFDENRPDPAITFSRFKAFPSKFL
jgi:hypothetical protein